MSSKRTPVRCAWAATNPLLFHYHDHEWAVPVHDDRHLFEMLILEGAQAGLSWSTILKKRENYVKAFDGFDPMRVAGYSPAKVQRLMADEGIIRNRLKIEATVKNARAFLAVQKEFGSFDVYIWRFTGGRPHVNCWTSLRQLPQKTTESEALSKDLRRRGFAFIGPTISYSFMQAVGMVNDHTVDCFRHNACARLR